MELLQCSGIDALTGLVVELGFQDAIWSVVLSAEPAAPGAPRCRVRWLAQHFGSAVSPSPANRKTDRRHRHSDYGTV